MAMAANPPLSPQSVPVSSATDNGDVSSPRNLPSPWAQVVRGVESISTAATGSVSPSPAPPPPPTMVSDCPEPANFTAPSGQKFSPENIPENSCNTDDNADRSKKPAWKRPLNGVIEPSSVMGGSVSWPALSESTRSTVKTSSDSVKPLSEGSASSSQGPIISQTPQKHVNTNPNHGMHRQRSMKHRGGGSGPVGGSAQGAYNRSPPPPPPPPPFPPPFPIVEMPHYVNYGNFMPPPALDSCARGPRPMGVVGTQAANDHSHSQRNSSRRNNFGPRPRGDGQYHHGGRRDPDRRDVRVPHQFIPRGCIPPPPPPPPGSAPFVPPHMRHMVSPMAFDMTPQFVYVPTLPQEPFRGVPLMAQASRAPGFYPAIDRPLAASIVKQIDYYFSDLNLVKDEYLRSNMDDEGWVSISLIANFRRVHQLTIDIPLILDSLRGSSVVEVKGDKIRRRNDWQRWIHTSSRMLCDSVLQAPTPSSEDHLQTSTEKMSLNDDSSSSNSQVEIVSPDESPNVGKGEITAEEACSSQT